ncbi:MAG: SDR family NAD(P)-dependent oxidoreductase [Terriglobia bacterium]
MDQQAYSLVTGASSGIGECFARALAARGRNLVLVARSGDRLARLGEELKQRHGVQVEHEAMDLGETGAAARLSGALRERGLEIDLLVNNAGFGAQGRFWTIPIERQAHMLRLNIQALVELCYLLLPPMVDKRRGGIINVSSTASFQALPYTSAYAATKAFVTSFSMGLTEELRPYSVRVVTLCPGTTRTNFFKAGNYAPIRFRGGFQAPEKVAEAGLRQLDRGGGLVLARDFDKLLVFAERFLPRTWIVRSAGQLFKGSDK